MVTILEDSPDEIGALKQSGYYCKECGRPVGAEGPARAERIGEEDSAVLTPLEALNRDLRRAAITLSDREARYLVDTYYSIQRYRIRAADQGRKLNVTHEPHEILNWMAGATAILEANIKAALGYYVRGKEIGRWSLSITGIGPVLGAGLVANIRMESTPSCSALWSYAGQDPTKKWNKGQLCPWNQSLKVTCWKIGESFVKFQALPSDHYGKYYVQRKRLEIEKNERGTFSEQARQMLQAKDFKKDTDAYKWYSGQVTVEAARNYRMRVEIAKGSGQRPALELVPEGQGLPMLPPAHIHERAKRWAVKLFLSHYWEVAYQCEYGEPPPNRPYVFSVLGHQDYIPPPNWPL